MSIFMDSHLDKLLKDIYIYFKKYIYIDQEEYIEPFGVAST